MDGNRSQMKVIAETRPAWMSCKVLHRQLWQFLTEKTHFRCENDIPTVLGSPKWWLQILPTHIHPLRTEHCCWGMVCPACLFKLLQCCASGVPGLQAQTGCSFGRDNAYVVCRSCVASCPHKRRVCFHFERKTAALMVPIQVRKGQTRNNATKVKMVVSDYNQ